MTALAVKEKFEIAFEQDAEIFGPWDIAFCEVGEDTVIASPLSLTGEGFFSDCVGLPPPSSVLEGGRMLTPQVAHTLASMALAARLAIRWSTTP